MKTKTESKCAVYWIRSPEHTNIREEGYVGITSDFDVRMGAHALGLTERLGLDWDTLVKSIIVEFNTKEDALVYERALRNEMNIGWNRAKGGGGGNREGVKASDETRAKMSASKRNPSDEARAKMSASKRNMSDETRAKISAARLGKKHSEESRAKMSASRLGSKASDETRAKISAARLGKKHSEETRAKIGASKIKFAAIGTHRDTGEVIRLIGNKEITAAGFNHGNISSVINGRNKTHKGFTWTREVL
jgi:predicted GIY-YIG superfamily endonuclease